MQVQGQEVLSAFVNMIADAVAARIEAKQSKPAVPQKLLTIKQAADYMGRTPKAVRHLITSGEIPRSAVKRQGRRVFLIKDRLDRWLAVG